ncbi:MAG: carboxypeptidase-like regulatory domain-containing protein, partial [Bryobacteraceae bacterium]
MSKFHIRFYMCVCLLIGAVPAAAQTALGTITGTITDPSGAPVPNVDVVAKATATGLTYRGGTTDSGVYVIPNLPIGQFEITASAPGFKQVQRTGLNLEVAQRLRVDLSLEVG